VILRSPLLVGFSPGLRPNTVFVQAPGLRAGLHHNGEAQAEAQAPSLLATPDLRLLFAADSRRGAVADCAMMNPHTS
jgi:hypothetical protein